MRYYVLKKSPTSQTFVSVGTCDNSDIALDYARHLKKRLGEDWRVKIRSEAYDRAFDSDYEFTYDKHGRRRNYGRA